MYLSSKKEKKKRKKKELTCLSVANTIVSKEALILEYKITKHRI
jgi:hypothetical protein